MSGIEKTAWVKHDGKYVNSYALIRNGSSGQEIIATVSHFLEGWRVWVSPKYTDGTYVAVFETKREAKAYVEKYIGANRKTQSKDWHPFGL